MKHQISCKNIYTWKCFEANPALNKKLGCPGYCTSIFIWSFFSVLEVSLESRLYMPLMIVVKFAFVCVIPLVIYLSFYLLSNALENPIFRCHSRKNPGGGKGKCMLWSPIRYPDYLLTGVCLVSKIYMWIVGIHCMKCFLPHYGIHLSIL